MKDFVREYWKTATAFAAGAFLLSLLVGLVTRNPFGVVILRALLLTVIFAGFGAGLRFVIRKYLPELARGEAGGRGQESARGTKIDITLPEERPEAMTRAGPGESGRRGTGAASSARTGPGDGDGEVVQQAEAEALDELAGELADELPAASDPGQSEDTAGDAESVEEQEGESEELQPLGRGGQKPSKVTEADSGVEGDLDSLPDISNLEVAGEQGSGSPHDRMGRGKTPQDSMRGAVSGQDPATIARAIRTVLKRDEKG